MISIEKKVDQLREAITNYKGTAAHFKASFLEKGGQIDLLFSLLKERPIEERKVLGQAMNQLKSLAKSRQAAFLSKIVIQKQHEEDFTLPPTGRQLGSLHPLTLIEQKVIAALTTAGFSRVDGPQIEDDWHNFEALNFPQNHPAREMHDTFFLQQGEGMLLRTHTSSIQIRTLASTPPPLKVFSLGKVFRNETISASSHVVFHQVEGLQLDEGVNFADLKGMLDHLLTNLFGESVKMRMRPSYFPFTIPSVEIDIACLLCKGKGCATCKQSGWVEVMGAGMVEPKVLENSKVDPKRFQGYAFGLGIERVAMLSYQIPDLRRFTENDFRFLSQF